MLDILKDINEEYFSDLLPDEIPDDEISDICESEIDITSISELDEASDIEAKLKI